MEIGSFIELQFDKGHEYFKGEKNVARLNTGRAAIFHAYRLSNCNSIWLPIYQCDTVRDFLKSKKVTIKYYHINQKFDPIDLNQKDDEAVLLVNYYGIMSKTRMKSLASRYKNVIIDNSQAFFCEPIDDCLNVYSCRKFIGVPDGAYVIGNNAEKYLDEYDQGFSSDTSLFLLQRIEYGCEGKAYESRLRNERRIDSEDIMKMSKLTRTILDGVDYEFVKNKRNQNFKIACSLFSDINKIDPLIYYDDKTIPMVYPLVVEDDELINRLQKSKHFQGHWWSYLLKETEDTIFENWISRYVIPITIDQRYGKEELDHINSVIRGR
jgi:hypothetical protein